MNRKIIAAIVAVIAIVAGLYAYLEMNAGEERWQGWIEADLLFVGADEAGRLEALKVEEGDRVVAGQPLFVMESDLQSADMEAAAAAVSQSKATLELAESAQKRPEEIAVLKAQEARAMAALAASKAEYERVTALVDKGISTRSRLDQTKAAYDADLATLSEVRRQIELAGLAARTEDIEGARQALNRAQAQLAAARVRLGNTTVEASGAASVQEIYYRPGEVVPLGRPVVSLLPPAQLKVRFFVPQDVLPRIDIGTAVSVHCDGCPDGMKARVTFIAREAEFTPPVIYSREERAKLIFRIEARPDDPEAVRIGQPVDISLDEEDAR
ncbi:MAG: HlyD family secretion protein [Flavobacteriaceae bacterium]